jgi:hypothetical protein
MKGSSDRETFAGKVRVVRFKPDARGSVEKRELFSYI